MFDFIHLTNIITVHCSNFVLCLFDNINMYFTRKYLHAHELQFSGAFK